MKPLRHHPVFSLDGRSRARTPALRLLLDERDHLFRKAAARFCVGMSDRQAAAMLRTALSRYRNGRWQRDRAEATCPVQHKGKLTEALWLLLKTRDAIPSERSVRAALAVR